MTHPNPSGAQATGSQLTLALPVNETGTMVARETWVIRPIEHKLAQRTIIDKHYLHRRAPCSFAFGLFVGGHLLGVCVFGTPASHHLCKSICPSDPGKALELNRLWLCDTLPRNSESWFVSRCLHALPPRLVLSYADTARGHAGYVYRALNFHYAGWTDMERKTPRYDYIVPGKHTRDAFRGPDGAQWTERIRREPKVKYWTATGNRRERRDLEKICAWPILSWVSSPHPPEAQFEREVSSAA
jgi:hypothetical protein